VWARYPSDGEGDPDAVPGVFPETEDDADESSPMLEVDGEVFVLRPDGRRGTHYEWVSGPNQGYGFTVSPTTNASLDAHRENIRGFLSQVDPATGYIEDE
jgi:hypothetical protein